MLADTNARIQKRITTVRNNALFGSLWRRFARSIFSDILIRKERFSVVYRVYMMLSDVIA